MKVAVWIREHSFNAPELFHASVKGSSWEHKELGYIKERFSHIFYQSAHTNMQTFALLYFRGPALSFTFDLTRKESCNPSRIRLMIFYICLTQLIP